jgi:hypothetical protein
LSAAACEISLEFHIGFERPASPGDGIAASKEVADA